MPKGIAVTRMMPRNSKPENTWPKAGSGNEKPTRIRAFYNGVSQFELAGQIEPGAYESQLVTGRKYFIMQKPMVRGLDLAHPELALLKGLDYAIVRKDRMAYVYDFS